MASRPRPFEDARERIVQHCRGMTFAVLEQPCKRPGDKSYDFYSMPLHICDVEDMVECCRRGDDVNAMLQRITRNCAHGSSTKLYMNSSMMRKDKFELGGWDVYQRPPQPLNMNDEPRRSDIVCGFRGPPPPARRGEDPRRRPRHETLSQWFFKGASCVFHLVRIALNGTKGETLATIKTKLTDTEGNEGAWLLFRLVFLGDVEFFARWASGALEERQLPKLTRRAEGTERATQFVWESAKRLGDDSMWLAYISQCDAHGEESPFASSGAAASLRSQFPTQYAGILPWGGAEVRSASSALDFLAIPDASAVGDDETVIQPANIAAFQPYGGHATNTAPAFAPPAYNPYMYNGSEPRSPQYSPSQPAHDYYAPGAPHRPPDTHQGYSTDYYAGGATYEQAPPLPPDDGHGAGYSIPPPPPPREQDLGTESLQKLSAMLREEM